MTGRELTDLMYAFALARGGVVDWESGSVEYPPPEKPKG